MGFLMKDCCLFPECPLGINGDDIKNWIREGLGKGLSGIRLDAMRTGRKRSLRIQQTQKSFSTMAGFMPSRLADSRNRSRLSEAGPAAILSRNGLLSDLLDDAVHPASRSLGIGQDFGT